MKDIGEEQLIRYEPKASRMLSWLDDILKQNSIKNLSDFGKLWLYVLLSSAAKYFEDNYPQIASQFLADVKKLEKQLYRISKDGLMLLPDELYTFCTKNKKNLPTLLKSFLFSEKGRSIRTYVITKKVTERDLLKMMALYFEYGGELKELEEGIKITQ